MQKTDFLTKFPVLLFWQKTAKTRTKSTKFVPKCARARAYLDHQSYQNLYVSEEIYCSSFTTLKKYEFTRGINLLSKHCFLSKNMQKQRLIIKHIICTIYSYKIIAKHL